MAYLESLASFGRTFICSLSFFLLLWKAVRFSLILISFSPVLMAASFFIYYVVQFKESFYSGICFQCLLVNSCCLFPLALTYNVTYLLLSNTIRCEESIQQEESELLPLFATLRTARAESESDFKIDNLLSFLTKEIPFRLPLLVRFFNKIISLCHFKFFLFSCEKCQN